MLKTNNKIGKLSKILNINDKYNLDISLSPPLYKTTFAHINGILYKPDLVVILDIDNIDSFPIFGIIEIIISADDNLFLICKETENIGYDDHFHCYIISEKDSYVCINIKNLYHLFPATLIRSERLKYVVLRVPL